MHRPFFEIGRHHSYFSKAWKARSGNGGVEALTGRSNDHKFPPLWNNRWKFGENPTL
jgi:hypothetical protein